MAVKRDQSIDDKKKISATAVPTLLLYSMLSVPLAKEFLDLARPDAQALDKTVVTPKARVSRDSYPFMELRYKLTDAALRELIRTTKAETVIEFASGLSPRGLNLVRDLPVRFIETDISEDFIQKQAFCKEIMCKNGISIKGKHEFQMLDAVKMPDIDKLLKFLQVSGPVILTNEGLMSYLKVDQRWEFAQNIRKIMRILPGSLWVTADFSLLNRMFFDNGLTVPTDVLNQWKDITASLRESLGIDPSVDMFRRERGATTELGEAGFSVEHLTFDSFSQTESRFNLMSPGYSELSPQKLERWISWNKFMMKAWVMRLRG